MHMLRMPALIAQNKIKVIYTSTPTICAASRLLSYQPALAIKIFSGSSNITNSGGQLLRAGRFANKAMSATTTPSKTKTLASHSPNSTLNSLSVAVIGAGAAGLAAARELLREGHHVSVFEQGKQIGGIWVYNENVEDDLLGINPNRKRLHSSMYANLRTNLPREVMGYLDYPFDTQFSSNKNNNKSVSSIDPRRFCSHQEVLLYLEAYAEEFDLVKWIRFNTTVTTVNPLIDVAINIGEANGKKAAWPRWRVSSCSNSSAARKVLEEEFDAVLVCNGHYSEPRVPQFPGFDTFPGLQTHSHNYRRPEEFSGKKVVLVGAAFSGMDIAQEIFDAGAAEVYLSAREWEDPNTGEAPDGSGSITPSSSSSSSCSSSSIIKVRNIEKLSADGSVVFEGGRLVENVDVVMYATGYVYRFPFLEQQGISSEIVEIDDNRVGPLYKHVIPPKFAPTLAFIGLPWKVVPFPQFQLQSRWIARCLSGKVEVPTPKEMLEDVERYYQWMEDEKLPVRYTHRAQGELQKSYNLWLSHAAGDGDLPEWRHELYQATGMARRANNLGFRDTPMEAFAGEALKAAAEEAKAVRRVAAEV
jgi:Flavin-binding monooxygenase-like